MASPQLVSYAQFLIALLRAKHILFATKLRAKRAVECGDPAPLLMAQERFLSSKPAPNAPPINHLSEDAEGGRTTPRRADKAASRQRGQSIDT